MGWIRVRRVRVQRDGNGRATRLRIADHWRWRHPGTGVWARIEPALGGYGYDWAVGVGDGEAWQLGWASVSAGQTVREVVFPVVERALALYTPGVVKRPRAKRQKPPAVASPVHSLPQKHGVTRIDARLALCSLSGAMIEDWYLPSIHNEQEGTCSVGLLAYGDLRNFRMVVLDGPRTVCEWSLHDVGEDGLFRFKARRDGDGWVLG